MNVLFLIRRETTPSSRIRILNNIPLLQKRGINASYEVIEPRVFKRFLQFRRCRNHDIVVLQKKMLPVFELKMLRSYSKRLIYDFDDAVYLKARSCSTNHNARTSHKRARRFANVIHCVDAVIPANDVLNAKVKELRPDIPTYVIPSAVETDGFEPKTDYGLNSTPTIGWIGTTRTQRYLHYIAPALRKVAKKIPFELRIISGTAPQIDGVEVRFCPWDVKGQYNDLRTCDVAIMPLSADPFSEGKSAYKLLQYMACALPSVCSKVGMNATISDGDTYCLCAESIDEFADKIVKLLSDQRLRETLGKKGHALTVEKYSYEKVERQLHSALTAEFSS